MKPFNLQLNTAKGAPQRLSLDLDSDSSNGSLKRTSATLEQLDKLQLPASSGEMTHSSTQLVHPP